MHTQQNMGKDKLIITKYCDRCTVIILSTIWNNYLLNNNGTPTQQPIPCLSLSPLPSYQSMISSSFSIPSSFFITACTWPFVAWDPILWMSYYLLLCWTPHHCSNTLPHLTPLPLLTPPLLLSFPLVQDYLERELALQFWWTGWMGVMYQDRILHHSGIY